MSYWTFKSNPKKYKLNERLNNPDPNTSWRITRFKHEIHIDDIAFIWRTGKDRGICAVVRIYSEPQEMAELDLEKQYYVDLDVEIRCRVKGTIIKKFPCISHKILRTIPGLESLSVFHGFQQATNFPVTEKEGNIIESLIQTVTK